MTTKPTYLRAHLYSILDQVAEHQQEVIVERKGVRIRIAPEEKRIELARLPKRDTLIGTPESLVAQSWEDVWDGDIAIVP